MLTSLLITFLVIGDPLFDDPRPKETTHHRHVRPLSNIARVIVSEAVSRSTTVADMIAELEELDVVVYIDMNVPLAPALGATTLMAASQGTRFLRIALNVTLEPPRRIEMLAHELQHALEIARGDVRDIAGMRRLFQSIGWETREGSYETNDAITVERKVRRELGAARPKPQLHP
jgi:hypothetical protein